MSKAWGYVCEGAWALEIYIRLDIPATVPDPVDPDATVAVRQARLELYGEMTDAQHQRVCRFIWGAPVPPDCEGDATAIVLDEVPEGQHNDIQRTLGAFAMLVNPAVAAAKKYLADYDYEIVDGTVDAKVKKPKPR